MDVQIKYDGGGLVPVIAQEYGTCEALMLAYANEEAVRLTLSTGQAHYFSRSRGEIWRKGATSGHTQSVVEVRYDCDADALLYLVRQNGAACHTGARSCFYRGLPDGEDAATHADALTTLSRVVAERRDNPKEGSYTNYLLDKGLDKILKKVGEESAETIIAAKNGSKEELLNETADLLYHLTVMLNAAGVEWAEVYGVLTARRK
jgi:phosphoribosyl-ATP pyrophosphohydrolase/phosphoribosyl-AMP cyclohydrolase